MRKNVLLPAAIATLFASNPSAAGATSTTCATTVVCAEYINTSSGVAIHGEANSGIGIRGTSVSNTGFYGASGSGSAGAPGVEGESTNASGNDAAAAFGLAFLSGKAAPAYGAIAYGSAYGVYGEAANPGTSSGNPGYGVFGLDGVGTVSNQADYNAAVFGKSTFGTAVLAEANAAPSLIYGEAPVGIYAVAKTAAGTLNADAFALFAETNSFGLDIRSSASNSAYEYVISPADFLSGNSTTGTYYIDYNGNESLSGTLTTTKGMFVRAKSARGREMMEYAERGTVPEVEDVGEAQLTNGRAFVSIDARLGDTIDRRTAYHVFVTPEGDCKGLFVTQKTPAGFVVRELQGGRSSLSFEYRIVAKPLGEDGTRLALAPPEPLHADDGMPEGTGSHRMMPAPLSPEARMKQRVGAQAYAEAMGAVRQRLTSPR